jgi:hypothetical protein
MNHKQLYVLMNVYHCHQILYVDDFLVVVDMINDEFDCVFLHLQTVFDEAKIPARMYD